LASSREHCLPRIQFLFIGSHLCSALLSGPTSRRVLFHPCASLSLHVHPVVKRTRTSKLSIMLGNRHRGSGRPLSPATPPYMRVRVRRFSGLRWTLPLSRTLRSIGALSCRSVERKFLGFSFSTNKEPKRRIAPKALLRCKQKIRERTQRTRGISLEQMTKELAAYLRGWKSYFGYCQTPSLLKALDEWIRRRLRCTIWKQWKRGPVRFRKLRQRGVSITLIANTIRSCHGPGALPTARPCPLRFLSPTLT